MGPVATASAAPSPEERAPEATAAPTANPRPLPNPSLRLDAGLGMVVLEFRDDRGEVSSSIPSQRILDAYRTHATPLPGTPPSATETSTPPDQKNEPPSRFA